MDFFERQDKARRKTKLLVFYFIVAICLLILALLALSGAKSELQSDVSLNAHAASAQDEASGALIEPQQSSDEMAETVLDIVDHKSYFEER